MGLEKVWTYPAYSEKTVILIFFVDSNLHGLAFYGLLEDVVTSLDKSVDLIDRSEVVPDSEIDNEIKKVGYLFMEHKDKQGLTKIYKHIMSILSYVRIARILRIFRVISCG